MRYLITIICLIILSACHRKEHSSKYINKIEFARSGAWQDWGAAVSIDSTLTYKYYGGKGKNRHYYTGKVSQCFWDTLNQKLGKINLNTARLEDSQNVVDVHYYEMIINWNNHKKRFVRSDFVITDSLSRFANWINNSYKKVHLKLTSKPIKFETTFQVDPSLPYTNNVKFPPPVNY